MLKTLSGKLPRRLIAFLCVGTIGFLVDASILSILIFDFDWNHYLARICSFGVALPVTWLLNRMWTFRSQATNNRTREYLIYALIQSLGALINLAIYSTCIYFSDFMMSYPVIALAVGSGVAMVFNFTAVRHFAFTGQTET